MFPENDDQFEEQTIKDVTPHDNNAYSIERGDGFSYFLPADTTVVPKVGDTARFYGAGIGSAVRGLFINSERVFYQTEEEYRVSSLNELYCTSAQEWLARWDSGSTVWSISMGGFGPGYEQAIQVAVAEIVRVCVSKNMDSSTWRDKEKGNWSEASRDIDHAMEAVSEKLGLSGAQYGAAMQLGVKLYVDGPIAVMQMEAVKNRHIQISKNFPAL